MYLLRTYILNIDASHSYEVSGVGGSRSGQISLKGILMSPVFIKVLHTAVVNEIAELIWKPYS